MNEYLKRAKDSIAQHKGKKLSLGEASRAETYAMIAIAEELERLNDNMERDAKEEG